MRHFAETQMRLVREHVRPQQIEALRAALQGPLTVAPGRLARRLDAQGREHHGAAVACCVNRGWLQPHAPGRKGRSKLVISERGRAALHVWGVAP